ncbi:MAG: hypothetical protein BMS9Abin06_0966 [Gammaproteobacteria bacterium]|nr:MAG: hypothetical protein BMS9Abin06_0966 [Gammaproteobacteria bacterium]
MAESTEKLLEALQQVYRLEPHGNALSIGFEGKRYSSSTRLSLDGLKYKIFDAAQVHAGLDFLKHSNNIWCIGSVFIAVTMHG